ncbi:acyl-CoA dehydrogenase family protein [Micromonospora sp. M12]
MEAAKAKLFATDMAMRVTTDAVQVLGGAGYVADHPVERYMREAKVLQIVEGTNQIQRMVISRPSPRADSDAWWRGCGRSSAVAPPALCASYLVAVGRFSR